MTSHCVRIIQSTEGDKYQFWGLWKQLGAFQGHFIQQNDEHLNNGCFFFELQALVAPIFWPPRSHFWPNFGVIIWELAGVFGSKAPLALLIDP